MFLWVPDRFIFLKDVFPASSYVTSFLPSLRPDAEEEPFG